MNLIKTLRVTASSLLPSPGAPLGEDYNRTRAQYTSILLCLFGVADIPGQGNLPGYPHSSAPGLAVWLFSEDPQVGLRPRLGLPTFKPKCCVSSNHGPGSQM